METRFTFASYAFGQTIACGAESVHSEAAPANELNTRGTAVRSIIGAVHKDEWDCLFPNGPALRVNSDSSEEASAQPLVFLRVDTCTYVLKLHLQRCATRLINYV